MEMSLVSDNVQQHSDDLARMLRGADLTLDAADPTSLDYNFPRVPHLVSCRCRSPRSSCVAALPYHVVCCACGVWCAVSWSEVFGVLCFPSCVVGAARDVPDSYRVSNSRPDTSYHILYDLVGPGLYDTRYLEA